MGNAAKNFTPRNGNGFWVFAYGSLMWDPGFKHAERRQGLLRGYHRAFCLYSHRYRGTPERPGLVLGLDRGGACRGIVYRVAAPQARKVRAYLWDRELNMNSYHPRLVPVETERGTVKALAFVVRREHPQYAGKLPPGRLIQCVLQGEGRRGTCRDYLASTVQHLDEMGLPDGPLHDLLRLVQERCG